MKYKFNTWSEKEKRLIKFSADGEMEVAEKVETKNEPTPNVEAGARINRVENALLESFDAARQVQLSSRELAKYNEANTDDWKTLDTGKINTNGKQFVYKKFNIGLQQSDSSTINDTYLIAYEPSSGFNILNIKRSGIANLQPNNINGWAKYDENNVRFIDEDRQKPELESIKNTYDSIINDSKKNTSEITHQNNYNFILEENILKAKDAKGAKDFLTNMVGGSNVWTGINTPIKNALDASLQGPATTNTSFKAPAAAPASAPANAPKSAPAAKPTAALNQKENSGLKTAFDQLDKAENREEQIKALVKIVVEIQKMLKDLGYNSEEKKEEPVTKPAEKKEEEKKPETNESKKPAAERVAKELENMEDKNLVVRVSVLDHSKVAEKNIAKESEKKQTEELKRQEEILSSIEKNDEHDDSQEKINQTTIIIEKQTEKINGIKKEIEATKNTIESLEQDLQVLGKIQTEIKEDEKVEDFEFIKDQSGEQLLRIGSKLISLSKDKPTTEVKPEKSESLVDKAKKYTEQLQKLITDKLWISNDKNAVLIKNAVDISAQGNKFKIVIDKQAIKNVMEGIKGVDTKGVNDFLDAALSGFNETALGSKRFTREIGEDIFQTVLSRLSGMKTTDPKSKA